MVVFYQIMGAKQSVLSLYKKRGETPLECLERFKIENPEYKNEKMTYAGRLDPLAEGLLLLLVGEECKNKEKYLGLDKEYEVDVLFGFATDTYDILGLVTETFDKDFVISVKTGIHDGLINLDSRLRGNDTINELLNSFIGRFTQKYPAYSSKTINGETMFSLSKSGKLNDEEIPKKDVEIKNIELLDQKTISKNDLEKYIINSINFVKGDFRQSEILKEWDSAMARSDLDVFNIISIKVNCTSGTNMRTLANSIGEKIGIPALALNIKRTKIGKYTI